MENKRVGKFSLSFLMLILSLIVGIFSLPKVGVAAMPSNQEVIDLFEWENDWQDNGSFYANIRTSRYRENQVNPEDMIDSYGNMTYGMSRLGDTNPRLLYVNYGYYLRRDVKSPEKPYFTKTADNVVWTLGHPKSWNNLPDHLDSYVEEKPVNGVPTVAKYDIPVNNPIELKNWPSENNHSIGLYYNVVPVREGHVPYESNSITMDFFNGTRDIEVTSPYTNETTKKTIQGRLDTSLSFFTKMNFDDTKVLHTEVNGIKQFDLWAPHSRLTIPQVMKVQYRDVDTKKELRPEEIYGKNAFIDDEVTIKNLDRNLSYYENLGYQEVNAYNYQRQIIYGTPDRTQYGFDKKDKVSELKQGAEYTSKIDTEQKGIVVWYKKQKPSPELDKTVTSKELKIGDTQNYQITLKNELTGRLKDAVLEDTLPEGMGKPKNLKLDRKTLSEKGFLGRTPYYEWDGPSRKLTVVTGSNLAINGTHQLTYDSVVEDGRPNETKRNDVRLIPKAPDYNELMASASFKIVSGTKPKAEKYAYHTNSFTDAGNPGLPIKEVEEKNSFSYMLKVWNEAGATENIKDVFIEDTLPPEVGEPTNIRLGMTSTNSGVVIRQKSFLNSNQYYEWNSATRLLRIKLDSSLVLKPGEKFTHVTFDTKLTGGEPGDQVINRMAVSSSNTADFYATYPFKIIGNRIVTFDSKGGTKVPESPVTVKHGNLVKKPTNPTKKGYVFEGWYLDDETFNKPFNFNNPIVKNITLYAKWLSTAKPNPTFVKTVNKSEVSLAEPNVEYRLKLQNSRKTGEEVATISQPVIIDTLPEGVRLKNPYVVKREVRNGWEKLHRKDEAPSLSSSYYEVETKTNASGKEQDVIIFHMQDVKENTYHHVSYEAVLKTGDQNEEKVNTAKVTANNIPTPIEASAKFKVTKNSLTVTFHGEENMVPKTVPDPKVQVVQYGEKAKEPKVKPIDNRMHPYSPDNDFNNKERIPDHWFDGWYTDEKLTQPYDFTKPVTSNVDLYPKWIPQPIPQSRKKIFDKTTLMTESSPAFGKNSESPGNEYRTRRVGDKFTYQYWIPKSTRTDYVPIYIHDILPDEVEKPSEIKVFTTEVINDPSDFKKFKPILSKTKVTNLPHKDQANGSDEYYEWVDKIEDKPGTIAKPNRVLRITVSKNRKITETNGFGFMFDTKLLQANDEMKIKNNGYSEGNLYAQEEQRNRIVTRSYFDIPWKVEFEPNGGAPKPADQYVIHKDKATKPADPTLKDKKFGGWYVDKATTIPYKFEDPVTKDMILYAKWDANPKVTFHGTENMVDTTRPDPNPQIVPYGELAKEPKVKPIDNRMHPYSPNNDFENRKRVPENIFGGWYTDEKLTNPYHFTEPVTSDVDLYPKWIPQPIPQNRKKAFDKNTLMTESTLAFGYESESPGNEYRTRRVGDEFTYQYWLPKSTKADYKPLWLYDILPDEVEKPSTISFFTTEITNDPSNFRKFKPILSKTKVTNLPHKDQANGSDEYYEWIDQLSSMDEETIKKPGRILKITLSENRKVTENTGFGFMFDTKILKANTEMKVKNVGSSEGNLYTQFGTRNRTHVTNVLDIPWKVEFEPNGGTPTPKTQYVLNNEKATEPTGADKPTHTNRAFEGWYEDEELTKKFNFNTKITKDMKLYAKWKSPIVDPGDGTTPIDPVNEEDITIPTNPDDYGLRIQYVSEFNFGEHENTKDAMKSNVFSDKAQFPDKKVKSVPTFVSIIDDSPKGKSRQWELTAKATKFASQSDPEGIGVKGTAIHLKDLNYAKVTGQYVPLAMNGDFDITTLETKISESGQTPSNGTWSLAMGKNNMEDIYYENGKPVSKKINKSNGAYLNVPRGIYKKVDEDYKANVVWTLTPKIK